MVSKPFGNKSLSLPTAACMTAGARHEKHYLSSPLSPVPIEALQPLASSHASIPADVCKGGSANPARDSAASIPWCLEGTSREGMSGRGDREEKAVL